MEPKAQKTIDQVWKGMVEDSKSGSGGIIFNWQKLNATSIDTPSKLTLLGLISDAFDNTKEREKTAKFGEVLEKIIPYKGQLLFLFEKVKNIPEVNP